MCFFQVVIIRIPVAQRRFFKELDYYPPNLDYRFVIELHEHDKKKILKIEDTKGNDREFFRWGEFRFKTGGKECTLQAYNPWCAYSENYACPYIDPENWLDVPVRAGEKNYIIGK